MSKRLCGLGLGVGDVWANCHVGRPSRGALGALIEHFFVATAAIELELSQRPTEAKQVEQNDGLLNADLVENARISRDYERLPEKHMIYVVMIRLMLRRLAKNRRTWQPEQLNQRLQTLSWY